MVQDLNIGVQIVTCPIIRDPDGLAMSSRNRYLSQTERTRALILRQALIQASDSAKSGMPTADIESGLQQAIEATNGVELDYAVVVDCDTLKPAMRIENSVALVAARVGTTRLIDNELLAEIA